MASNKTSIDLSKLDEVQKNIVVNRLGKQFFSAVAGSGKTLTMVNQYVSCILDDGFDMSRMLTITFTEKAANELKDRIRKTLLYVGAAEQADRISEANISTFHAFCTKIIKKFPYIVGVDPKFKVLEEKMANELKRHAFENSWKKFFSKPCTEKIELLSEVKEGILKEMIFTAYSKLQTLGVDKKLPAVTDDPTKVQEKMFGVSSLCKEASLLNKTNQSIEKCVGFVNIDLKIYEPSELMEEVQSLTKIRGRDEIVVHIKELANDIVSDLKNSLFLKNYELIREFFELFCFRYQSLKDEDGYLDFGDLELRAVEVLSSDQLGNYFKDKFLFVQIDEFQDTNELQTKIIQLLDPGHICLVGDEFQSIYGWRNADIGLFRDSRDEFEKKGRLQTSASNYRSTQEILTFIGEVFGSENLFGQNYHTLNSCGKTQTGGKAEVLVVGYEEEGVDKARRAEANEVISTILRLNREGVDFGDIAILFRGKSHILTYEDSLKKAGVPYHVLAGKGFYTKDEVDYLINFLSLIANPLNDMAMLGLFYSPYMTLSDDAVYFLATLGRANSNNDQPLSVLWRAVSKVASPESFPDEIDDKEIEKIIKLHDDIQKIWVLQNVSLATLVQAAIEVTNFDLSCALNSFHPVSALANLKKIIRMAKDYEDLSGPDLRGFIDFLQEQKIVSDEGDAPAFSEKSDTVKLMTIHSAKGLEFENVILADCGTRFTTSTPYIIIDEENHCYSLGLKMDETEYFDYKRLKERHLKQSLEEELRIYYVGATRAKKRLIISGIIKRSKINNNDSFLKLLIKALDNKQIDGFEKIKEAIADGSAENFEFELGGFRYGIKTVNTGEERPPAPSFKRNNKKQSIDFDDLPELYAPKRDKNGLPLSLSYSALQLYKRCQKRFYLENILKIQSLDDLEQVRKKTGSKEISQTDFGTIAHNLLAKIDWQQNRSSIKETALINIKNISDNLPSAAADEIKELFDKFSNSTLTNRISTYKTVQNELPFSLLLLDGLVEGRFDLFAYNDLNNALIVDYKTGKLDSSDYGLQEKIYALAGLIAGFKKVEVLFAYLGKTLEEKQAFYDIKDKPALESEIKELLLEIKQSDFPPLKHFDGPICGSCPGCQRFCFPKK